MFKAYEGVKVLVTGHTGFKGSWLSIWLHMMGAKVIGYSLDPPTKISNFSATGLQDKIIHIKGDIRDATTLKKIIAEHQPAIIFHLAAQSIVLHSFGFPKDTFEINALGTINLIEAARFTPSVKAMVMVATDKCYENKEWVWGYRENDPLGGDDPYSASKAMSEIAIQSYRASFFKNGGPAIASARAGNVIGGGDFSDHRILPDAIRALMTAKTVGVRNPHSIRPWLYVLDALYGYLKLGEKLFTEGHSYAEPWNFGPIEKKGVTVRTLVEKTIDLWGNGSWSPVRKRGDKSEKSLLKLNWDKAAQQLDWKPICDWENGVEYTVEWFKAFEKKEDMYKICAMQIESYERNVKCDLPKPLYQAPIL